MLAGALSELVNLKELGLVITGLTVLRLEATIMIFLLPHWSEVTRLGEMRTLVSDATSSIIIRLLLGKHRTAQISQAFQLNHRNIELANDKEVHRSLRQFCAAHLGYYAFSIKRDCPLLTRSS